MLSTVISIDSARTAPKPQPPSPAKVSTRRTFSTNQHPNQYSRITALRMFYLLGSGLWKVQRRTGVPTCVIENDLRDLGRAEYERRFGRAA